MPNVQILNEVPITMAELKERLEDIKKRDKELNAKAQKTHNYLTKFVDIKVNEANKLKESIIKLNIPRLKDRHIVKIIDLMPKDLESLKLIFSTENITIKQEDIQKILNELK